MFKDDAAPDRVAAFDAYLEHPAHQALARDHLLPLAESFHSTQFLTEV